MKLYYSKGACSLVIRIVINEMGLKCEYESVDLKTKKTSNDKDYLKVNPKGAVPALALAQNEVLTENSVIQQYLADSNKAVGLLPPVGDFKRYRVLEWLNFVTTDIHKGFSPLFNGNVTSEMKENVFIPILQNKFALIDSNLKNKKFMMGDQFTLPDAYLFVMLMWAESMKIDLRANTELLRYFDALKTRDSIVKSLQEEGLK